MDEFGSEVGRSGWDPIITFVHADDPISASGATAQLRTHQRIRLVDELDVDEADVAVVLAQAIDDETLRVLRAMRRGDRPRLVVVTSELGDADIAKAAEVGVSGLLRRREATPTTLARAVERVHDGHGELPSDLVGRLMDQLGRLQRNVLSPKGMTLAQLSAREAEVLRLVAEGNDTAEIAAQMCYSERTVKNVLHDLTTRLQLKNRTHAVAYAVREGLI